MASDAVSPLNRLPSTETGQICSVAGSEESDSKPASGIAIDRPSLVAAVHAGHSIWITPPGRACGVITGGPASCPSPGSRERGSVTRQTCD
jgi:hypothetical protein